MPSEYGIQRKPWFLCTPSYWCGTGASAAAPAAPLLATSAVANDETLVVEPLVESVAGRGVRVSGLRKVWPRGVAVHGLDLEMAPGQITGLLGANGAGKTTTISMLTGLITPTAGEAAIDGKSISTQMQQIRLSLGVCPQVNPFDRYNGRYFRPLPRSSLPLSTSIYSDAVTYRYLHPLHRST